ncbi:MAG: acetyl-CoA C-acyltransferase, partial [Deltaproteobacteria bacterium]
MRKDIVLLGGVRTPFGSFCGSLNNVSATDLAVVAARGALERTNVPASDIDHVIFGNALQTSPDAIYLARHVGLKAGVPEGVPAYTINRLCGSGFQALVNAGQEISLDEAEVVLAGGTESMSQAPHTIRGARTGIPLGKSTMGDYLWEALLDTYVGLPMALTAENLAEKYGISREDADAYAYRSQMAYQEALKRGIFAEEIVPVETHDPKRRPLTVTKDEHPRPNTTLEGLAKLPPVFKRDGVITAGNASGICDGGAAMVVASEAYAKRNGLHPIGRLIDYAVVGCDPKIMGIGPVPAIRKVLERAEMTLTDIDLIEVNEAFAPQYLAVERELELDRERTNVN